jgi:putative transposase
MAPLQTGKTIYHPLVSYLYHTGNLEEKYFSNIPYTTRVYWQKHNLANLYGYDWVKDFSSGLQDFEKIRKQKIIFKAMIFCCRIINTFSKIISECKNYRRALKKNASILINTIEYLALALPLQKACKVFSITTYKYYRWKNNINCSASLLNLCFKSHPRQLSLSEGSILQEALLDQQNIGKPLTSLRFELMNKEMLFISLSSFYKYYRLFIGLKEQHSYKKQSKHFYASKVFEYIHIDTSFVMTEVGKKRMVL